MLHIVMEESISAKLTDADSHPALEYEYNCVSISTGKPGRRAKFKAGVDIIVREVAASKAHVAGFGEITIRYEQAAALTNSNSALSCRVTGKSIKCKYKKLQDQYDKKEACRVSAVMSANLTSL